ncbi:MAG: iron-containing alcohol dehydrogenase, partial [Myxococcales bacterium]
MRQIRIATLARIKPGCLGRVGVYLARHRLGRVVLLHSHGLPVALKDTLVSGLASSGVAAVFAEPVVDASFEAVSRLVTRLPAGVEGLVGLGGGRALDAAKYVATMLGLPYVAVPTSVSNDGFCSPLASLTVGGARRTLPCEVPFGVVVDTEVCLGAPRELWLAGIGDLVAKLTAVQDWKLAFHADGTPIDDYAALVSDASVAQFMARPARDLEGMRLLATALLLNGLAMEMAGSSRPASGSEHLVSHALDASSAHPRTHGLQVGLA